MSRKHPIISITGSSGAGTTSVKKTFEQIFFREKVNAICEFKQLLKGKLCPC